MKKIGKMTVALLLLVLAQVLVPDQVPAALEWSLKKQLKLEQTPVDVAVSADGKWIFVLSSGEITVYAAQDDKVIKHIPLDKSFDRLVYTAPDNSLVVTSSAEKTMKIIQLDVTHTFSLDGLPFMGSKNAPVTLVVFSDYQ